MQDRSALVALSRRAGRKSFRLGLGRFSIQVMGWFSTAAGTNGGEASSRRSAAISRLRLALSLRGFRCAVIGFAHFLTQDANLVIGLFNSVSQQIVRVLVPHQIAPCPAGPSTRRPPGSPQKSTYAADCGHARRQPGLRPGGNRMDGPQTPKPATVVPQGGRMRGVPMLPEVNFREVVHETAATWFTSMRT